MWVTDIPVCRNREGALTPPPSELVIHGMKLIVYWGIYHCSGIDFMFMINTTNIHTEIMRDFRFLLGCGASVDLVLL